MGYKHDIIKDLIEKKHFYNNQINELKTIKLDPKSSKKYIKKYNKQIHDLDNEITKINNKEASI